MGAAKFDDNTPENQKLIDAGGEAAWLWFCSVLYCRKALTDGFIPKARVPLLFAGLKAPYRLASRLVACRLWHEVDGGFRVHDFLDWNPTKTQIESYRKKDRERKQFQHGIRSGIPTDSSMESESESDRIPNDSANARATRARAEYVSESESEGFTAQTGRDLDSAAFEAFWQRYPCHQDKPGAWRAWRRLAPDADLIARIQAALDWQVRQPGWQAEQGRYVPHAMNWLDRRRWDDEPTVSRPSSVAVDWRAECAELHAGRCSNVHFHQAMKEHAS